MKEYMTARSVLVGSLISSHKVKIDKCCWICNHYQDGEIPALSGPPWRGYLCKLRFRKKENNTITKPTDNCEHFKLNEELTQNGKETQT